YAILNEIGISHRLSDSLGKGELAFLRQALGQHLPVGAARAFHHLADLALGLGVRVEDRDVYAVEEQARDPARADDSTTYGGRLGNRHCVPLPGDLVTPPAGRAW